MARPIMTTEYKSLKDYEGEEIQIKRWAWRFGEEENREPPSSARILKDYPKTVLFELTYEGSAWGIRQLPPSRILKLIPKSAMAIEDVALKVTRTGERLNGQNITRFTTEGAAEIWTELMKL